MLNVLKEYLVSLGFKVDNSSLNAAQRAMKTAEDSVTSFGNKTVTNFAKAGTGVVAFVATTNLALAKFMHSLGQSDLQNEMFARRMWMSADAARAYTNSVDALGVSLQDLYLSPELMSKYKELNGQAKGMAVPDYSKQMQGIRDITFQFQRLKLEGTYALQWIGFYLTKYLAGPFGDFKGLLTKINDTIQLKMPEWTKKVAEVASWFVKLGLAAWNIRDALGAVIAVFTAFKLINMASSPLGLMIVGLTALLLLVDDFTTYQRGGESAFPALWKWLDKLGDSTKASGLDLKNFKGDLTDILGSVKELGTALGDLFKVSQDAGAGNLVSDALLASLRILDGLLKGMAESVKLLAAGLQGLTTGDWGKFNESTNFWDNPMKGYRDNLKSKWGVTPETDPENKVPSRAKGTNPDGKTPTQKDKATQGIWDQLKDIFNFFKNGPEEYRNSLKAQLGQTSFGGSLGAMSLSQVNYMHYAYPQNNKPTMTTVNMTPTYHIYGASQPGAVATTVNRSNADMITRAFQGVNR